MGNLVMALGYVIVVLHEFWRPDREGEKALVPVGTVLEVTRSERNGLVSGQVARDATDEEIAEFRGEPLPENAEFDQDELLEELAAAQQRAGALQVERDGLQASVQALESEKAELTKSVAELNDEVDKLKAANEAQAKALAAKKAATAK